MRKDEVEYANRPWRRMVRIGTWGVVGLGAYWSIFQRDLSGYADENGENVFTEVRHREEAPCATLLPNQRQSLTPVTTTFAPVSMMML